MISSEKKATGFEKLMHVSGYIAFIILMALFLYHTSLYLGHIFEDTTDGVRNSAQDLSAAAVQIALILAVICAVTAMMPRGKKPEADETDQKPGEESAPGN